MLEHQNLVRPGLVLVIKDSTPGFSLFELLSIEVLGHKVESGGLGTLPFLPSGSFVAFIGFLDVLVDGPISIVIRSGQCIGNLLNLLIARIFSLWLGGLRKVQ